MKAASKLAALTGLLAATGALDALSMNSMPMQRQRKTTGKNDGHTGWGHTHDAKTKKSRAKERRAKQARKNNR